MRTILQSRKHRTCLTMVALGSILTLALSGCAFMDPDNTPTVDLVRDHLWPETTGKQILAAPVVLPLGFAAWAVDAAIVRPAVVIDDAALDTKDACWQNLDWDEKYISSCASVPWRAAFSTVVFTVDYVVRVLFDIPQRAEKLRKQEEHKEQAAEALAAACKAMEEGNAKAALVHIKRIDLDQVQDEEAAEICLLRLRAAWGARSYNDLHLLYAQKLQEVGQGEQLVELVEEMVAAEDVYGRWRAYEFGLSALQSGDKLPALLGKALADDDPIVRHRALLWVKAQRSFPNPAELLPIVEKAAADDGDAMNRATAKELIEALSKPRSKG